LQTEKIQQTLTLDYMMRTIWLLMLAIILTASPPTIYAKLAEKKKSVEEIPPEILKQLKQKQQNRGGADTAQIPFFTTDNAKCEFSCKNGGIPKKKSKHVPKYDGCGISGLGVQGFDFEPKYDSDFHACCNDHDRCYNTCGKSKDKCDGRFHVCMQNWCEAMFGEGIQRDMNDKKNVAATKSSLQSCRKRYPIHLTLSP
jgi:hypothetical protein